MDKPSDDVHYTVQTLLLAAGWSLQECQSYAREHTAKQKKLTEFESAWTVSDCVIDLELVVLALNLLDENVYQSIGNWQQHLVDFFINQRQTITMEEQQRKRKAVHRKTQMRPQKPDDTEWIDRIRWQWKLLRPQLDGYDAFKVAMDWILRPQPYRYTVSRLLSDANRTSSEHNTDVNGHCWDHVVELQVVVFAVNRLWEGTYSSVDGWQRKLVDFFDQRDNLQLVTIDENEQKRLAISRVIHCPSQLADEDAWLSQVRARWQAIRGTLSGFVAFKVHMDSILRVTDSKG